MPVPVHAPEGEVAPASEVAGRRAQLSVVVLTQGDRSRSLGRALASVRAQQGVEPRVVLVSNGAPEPLARPGDLAPEDDVVLLPRNVGIPGGRNVGVAATSSEVVLFLDDDAALLDADVLRRVAHRFAADLGLGALALRIVDEDGRTQQRHVPRIGSRSAARSGAVTHFVGAACAVRAEAFAAVGGFDPRFEYAMEETDLSWRLLDDGWSIFYDADLRVFHPRTAPSRHPGHVGLTARNRLWAAWRSLPLPLFATYVSTWGVLTAARGDDPREALAGYRRAWSDRPARRPISWRTVLTMTRLGRPPVV